MKVAVTFENNKVFQHFGKTRAFKIYDIENTVVKEANVIETNTSGHEGMVHVLTANNISTLICGNVGTEARELLADNNIEVISGITGDCDEVVQDYLKGTLESQESTCGCHEDENHECHCQEDDQEGGCCGGDCSSGCGGCCGGEQYQFEGTNVGKTLVVHYSGTYNDGSQFDSSYDRGQPLEFKCGIGMMIPGFDKACAELKPGETIDVHLKPEEAYGEYDKDLCFTINYSQLPGSEALEVGQKIVITNAYGQQIPCKVVGKDDQTITFDTNHDMAGKELNFHIELVAVK